MKCVLQTSAHLPHLGKFLLAWAWAVKCKTVCLDLVEDVGILVADPVEHRILDQLLEPLLDRHPPLRPHQQVEDVELVARPQQFLDERFAHESGRSGDEYFRALVESGDVVRGYVVIVHVVVVVVERVLRIDVVHALLKLWHAHFVICKATTPIFKGRISTRTETILDS
jgi:hypothetical protein